MEPTKESVSFGKKITDLRNSKGLSQYEIASALSMGQSTYAGYESGKRNPTLSIIRKFAKYFSVSPDFLVSDAADIKCGNNVGAVKSEPPHYSDLLDEYRAIVDSTSEQAFKAQALAVKSNLYAIKNEQKSNVVAFRLSEQPASAGHGFDLGPENFRIIYVRDGCLPYGAEFGTPVSGDSMEPIYHDGDILIVDGQPVEIGDIGVFTLNGDGYVKRLGNGELISLNPEYKPIKICENDYFRHNGNVIGVLNPDCIVDK